MMIYHLQYTVALTAKFCCLNKDHWNRLTCRSKTTVSHWFTVKWQYMYVYCTGVSTVILIIKIGIRIAKLYNLHGKINLQIAQSGLIKLMTMLVKQKGDRWITVLLVYFPLFVINIFSCIFSFFWMSEIMVWLIQSWQ